MLPFSTQALLSVLSGTFVGFSLGLVGGGGSILAVPLLVYVVRIGEPHLAIGTSAVAVAGNAAVNLWHHARGGKVLWACASVFAVAGIFGAFFGSTLGKMVDGQKLLAAFAVLMMAIAGIMVRGHTPAKSGDAYLNSRTSLRLAVIGLIAGCLSGFFGIGGGFLIVPGLMLATGMSILNAIASSLVAVTAFGATTAANYALSGAVDWPIAALFLAGGAFGGFAGSRLAHALSSRRGLLNVTFAGLIFLVGAYMLARSLNVIWR